MLCNKVYRSRQILTEEKDNNLRNYIRDYMTKNVLHKICKENSNEKTLLLDINFSEGTEELGGLKHEIFDLRIRANGWISVKEALPEEDRTWVLATVDYGDGNRFVEDVEYINGDFIVWDGGLPDTVTDEVVAWMPLPEAYKED